MHSWSSLEGKGADYGSAALGIASAGSVIIILVFLSVKKKLFIEIISGIVLTIFGNLALLTFLNVDITACFTGWGPLNALGCSPFQNYFVRIPDSLSGLSYPIFSYPTLILLISNIMLLLGLYFLLRNSYIVGGLIFAAIVILGIVYQRIVLSPSPSIFSSGSPYLIGFWFPPFFAVIAIIASIFKIIHKNRKIA